MIDRIEHIVLNRCNLEATPSWYAYAWLPAGHLFEPRRAGPAHRAQVRPAPFNLRQTGDASGWTCKVDAPGSLDLCFVTEVSLKPVSARLEAAGIPIIAGPAPRSGALGPMTSICCEDADGNLVEVSTYASSGVA